MIFAIDLIQKLYHSKPNYISEDIRKDFEVYWNNDDWLTYDSASIPEGTYILAQWMIDGHGYIDTEEGPIYTSQPGAIIKDRITKSFILPNTALLCGILYSNFTLWLSVSPYNFRYVLFIKKEYQKRHSEIPLPEHIIEYVLTSRMNFDEPDPTFYFDPELW